MQLDSFNDLPKEHRPPHKLIWDAPIEDLEKWIENIYKNPSESDIYISDGDIER